MSQSDVDSLYEQGRAALKSRQIDDSIELFRQALTLEPQHTESLESLASALFVKGDFPAAAEYFARLADLIPTQTRFNVNLGAVLNRMGNHKQAEAALRKVLQRDPRNFDAYYNLGITYRKTNQTNLAISAYREAVRLNPQMAEAYYNLGNIYADLKNHTLAAMNFRKALESRPDFEKASLGLAQAEKQMESARQAISPFGRLAPPPNEVVAPTTSRELTEDERAEDRRKIYRLAEQIEQLAEAAISYLHETLEPRLMEVQKAVAGGRGRNLAVGRAGADFREAVEEWSNLRRQLRRKVLELRAHEELIATPDVAI